MAAVIWTEKSLTDLEDIFDYIASDSPFMPDIKSKSLLLQWNVYRHFQVPVVPCLNSQTLLSDKSLSILSESFIGTSP